MRQRSIIAIFALAVTVFGAPQDHSFDALLQTASVQVRAGSSKDAVATLERARSLAPADPQAVLRLSRAYREAGDWIASTTLLQELATRRPQDTELAFQLGKAYRDLGAWSADQLRARHPDSARVHQLTAEAFVMNGRQDSAIAEYRRALAKAPTLPGSHLGLASIYASRRQWNEARQAIDAELKIAPDSIAAQAFARMLAKAQQP